MSGAAVDEEGQAPPFTFAIPLIARAAAADWLLVEALFGLTLASLAQQQDRRFRVLVAGHDRPALAARGGTAPFEFLQADWPVEPPCSANRDGGRKKLLLNAAALAHGGGLMMFLDADDWVDTRLVATARAAITPDHVGGLVATGFAIDPRGRRALPVPHPAGFAQAFDRLCGSSTVLRLDPAAADPLRRDPYRLLHEHYRFDELCAAHGLAAARLDVAGAYVVNTRANHSTTQGPFAPWRRAFDRLVAREGAPVDQAFLRRFGLDPGSLDVLAGGAKRQRSEPPTSP